MLEIIVGTALAFLAIVGAAEIAVHIRNSFFEKIPDGVTEVVTVRGHDESVEYRLRSLNASERPGILPSRTRIVVVDEGMDAETAAICGKLADEYGNITVCAPGELYGRLA
jgi:hypothetical protein